MKLKNILLVIVIVLCLSAMWSAYRKFDIKSRTYIVTHVSIEDSISGECLTIKNEHPVNCSENGFFQNTVAGGSRVFKGQTVGCLYIGDFDEGLVSSLNTVNENLREAQLSQNSKETLINDTMTVDNTIFSYTSMISELAADRNQQEINRLHREIDSLLERKRNIAAGSAGSVSTHINELSAQKASLETQLGNSKRYLVSPASGLFIMDCDGLEAVLNIKGIEQLNVARVEEYLNADKKNNDGQNEQTEQAEKTEETVKADYAPAKVTDNNKWVLAAVCETEKAQILSTGKAINVRLKTEGEQTIVCTVEYITDDEDGKCVVFVSGTEEIENIYNSRIVDAEILIKDYEGLRMPKKAVKTDDSGTYADVLKNGVVEQRRIEIIYEEDDFVLVSETSPAENRLQLYDEVISSES